MSEPNPEFQQQGQGGNKQVCVLPSFIHLSGNERLSLLVAIVLANCLN